MNKRYRGGRAGTGQFCHIGHDRSLPAAVCARRAGLFHWPPVASGAAMNPGQPLVLLLAALLLGCAGPAPVAPTPGPDAALDPVSSSRWAHDMARFAAEDAAHPPPARPVVFTGSSPVRMWASLAADFPRVPVLNRGFGGSQLRDATRHADQVAVRYAPRRIVLYAGDNDIDAGRTPEQVRDDFRAFVARVRRDLPGVPIAYLAIKPSPARLDQLPAQQ